MSLKDRIAAKQGSHDQSKATPSGLASSAPAFIEALRQAGDFDSAYKRAFERADNLAEKSRLAGEYVRLYPNHAAKSEWLPAVLDIATHLTEVVSQSKRRRSKWDHLSPDVPRRREVLRDYPNRSPKEYCELYDEKRIGLPPKWEQDFGVNKWAKVFEDKKGRQRIQRMICEDRQED